MNGKNIRINIIIISIIFGILPSLLCSKMVANAQTFAKTDISYTEEVIYQKSDIVVARDEVAGKWGYYNKTGTFCYFDSVSNAYDTSNADYQTYLHCRKAVYQDGELVKFQHFIYLFPASNGNIESVTIPEDGKPFYGMSGMYTVTPYQIVIETDKDENVTSARRDKYYDGRLHYPYNSNTVSGGSTYNDSKDIRVHVLGYGGNILDSEGNDFFLTTPQGTIATVMKNNQIQLNPLQEIVKVLPMVILFLVGYLGLWKALEIFRRLLRKESIT